MPIAFRYNDAASDFAFGGEYLVLCDHCGTEIDQDGAHNIETPQGSPGEIVVVKFYHYHCCREAQRVSRVRMYWRKLNTITIA